MLDFYSDHTGAILREIISDDPGGIPDFVVKNASLIPSEAFREEKRAWAWPEQKQFALDEPGDVWLSSRYFEKTSHLIPFQHHGQIAAAIAQAALIHNVDLGGLGSKVAAEEIQPIYLVQVIAALDSDIIKNASQGQYEQVEAGYLITDYPVHTKEATQRSIQWYPRGLSGELAPLRTKVATGLIEKAAEFGLNITEAIEQDTRPIKASGLMDEIGMRVQYIYAVNAESVRTSGLLSKSASMGIELPYDVKQVNPIDQRYLDAYDQLSKKARQEPLPKEFFAQLELLDKHAGLENEPGLTPASVLSSRTIEYDSMPSICKLAGTIINISELMEKVSRDMWTDVAPEILNDLHSPAKMAKSVEQLPLQVQKILLTKTRGF